MIKEYKADALIDMRRVGVTHATWTCVECRGSIRPGDDLWLQVTSVSRYAVNWKGQERKLRPRKETHVTCVTCATERRKQNDLWLKASTGGVAYRHFPPAVGKLHEREAMAVEAALAEDGDAGP